MKFFLFEIYLEFKIKRPKSVSMSGDALDLQAIYDEVVNIDSKLCYLVRLFQNIEIPWRDSGDYPPDDLFERIADITHENTCYGPFIRYPVQKIKEHLGLLIKRVEYTQENAAPLIEQIYERQVNFVLSRGAQGWDNSTHQPRPIRRTSPVLYSPFEWWTCLMMMHDTVIPEIFEPLEISSPWSFTISPLKKYNVGVSVLDFKIYLHDDYTMDLSGEMKMQLDYEQKTMHFLVKPTSQSARWQREYNGQTIREVKNSLLSDIQATNQLIFKNLKKLEAYSEQLGYPVAVRLSCDWSGTI